MKIAKAVLLAGKKSHAPGAHEYEEDLALLKQCLEESSLSNSLHLELHTNGWPEQVDTLDTADVIVLFSDGPDVDEKNHPFLVGNRMERISRQMQRGCGLVLEHYATFFPRRFKDEALDWCGGYFDYENGPPPSHWYSRIKMDTTTPELIAPDHPILNGVIPFQINEEYYYRIRFKNHDPRLTPLLRTSIKDETESHIVAWALERANGGRGFGITMGHFHANLAIDGFRGILLNGIAWAAGLEIPGRGLGAILPEESVHERSVPEGSECRRGQSA